MGNNLRNLTRLPGIASKDFIVIDLSGNTLKMAHISSALNKTEVVSVLAKNIAGMPDEDVVKALKNSLSELKAKNPTVINIIPSQLVITKNIEIPSTDPKEIKGIISLQAGRHTPYSREEIIVDYIEIGTFKNSYSKILLLIVARSMVKKQLDIITKAGLKLEKVLLAAEGISWSLHKLFKLETENYPASIVHVDEHFTDFSIIFKNKPIFIRSIPIGSTHLAKPQENYEARFLEELKRSLEAYQSEDIEKMPNILVLTGAVEGLKNLQETLNNYLHFPIKTISYFKQMPVSAQAQNVANTHPGISFLNITAPIFVLDKLKVDLVPEEVKLRRSLEERGRELVKTGIFVLAIFVLIFSILLTSIYFKNAYFKKITARYLPLKQEAKDLESGFERISLVKNYLKNRGFSLEVLTELYSISPENLKVSDIRFDELAKFTVRGTAEAMSTVFSFVEDMEKSKYFEDVKTRYTSKRKEGLGDVTDFEIVCALSKKTD